jgi:hypothetical protein
MAIGAGSWATALRLFLAEYCAEVLHNIADLILILRATHRRR